MHTDQFVQFQSGVHGVAADPEQLKVSDGWPTEALHRFRSVHARVCTPFWQLDQSVHDQIGLHPDDHPVLVGTRSLEPAREPTSVTISGPVWHACCSGGRRVLLQELRSVQVRVSLSSWHDDHTVQDQYGLQIWALATVKNAALANSVNIKPTIWYVIRF